MEHLMVQMMESFRVIFLDSLGSTNSNMIGNYEGIILVCTGFEVMHTILGGTDRITLGHNVGT